ncbi:MAG: J domain-containing protein [Sphingomonas sp.]|uniref:hypothetical protein n=1 Tax=Sphingomonas sp. TaxID=28214 RepID=UPI0035695463
MKTAWAILGVARGADRDAIRKAYARKLKVTNPEDDPEGFKTLRAAYEQALEALRWAQYDIADEEDEWPSDGTASDEPGDDARWTEPSRGPAAEASADVPTIEERERADELAAFQEITRGLSALLEAPERDDRAVERQFVAFRQSPALTEIAVRASAETWLADLLARTVPRSDAILREATDLFGWDDSRRQSWSVLRLMARLDEWRLIAALGQPGHRLHRGWLALRGAPKSNLAWRLGTLAPGVAGQVRALLERIDGDAPGVAHSLDPAVVQRWRDWLATPRVTPGKLIATPIALAIVWLFARLVPPGLWRTMALGLGGGLALAMPLLLLVGERTRRKIATPAQWFDRGWVAAYILTVAATLLTPPGTVAAMIVTMLAAITALWIGEQRDADEPLASGPSAIFWLTLLYIAGVAGVSFLRIDPSSALILGVVLPLYPLMRIIAWRRLTYWVALWRPAARDAGLTAIVVAAVILTMVGGAVRTRFGSGTVDEAFVACAIGSILILPPTSLLGAFGSGWGKLVHFIVVRGLVVVLVATATGLLLHGDDDRAPPGGDLSPTATVERWVDRLLDDIGRREPGFAQIATGNPTLYAAFRAIAQRDVRERRSEDVIRDINALIAERFAAQLPQASDAQMAEELRIRLAEREALIARDPAGCAAADRPSLPAALAARRKALVFDVLAHPPAAAPTGGRALTSRSLIEEAMHKKGLSVADLNRLFANDASPAERCRAAIVYLGALAAHRDADIAATIRAERRLAKKP